MNPFFSIIVPCYNQANYLSDCLKSVQTQSFLDWSLIIVDDGSDDETSLIGKKFSQIDSRITYFFQNNKGLSSARNTGMNLSLGMFFLFLDSDDWLEVDCLQSFYEEILANPTINLFRCGYGYWDKPNGNCYHIHLPYFSGSIYPMILTDNLGPCHSIVVKSELANSIGGFDPTLRSCEDWDFWMRIGRLGSEVKSISKQLVAYRRVFSSMSRQAFQLFEALQIVSLRATLIDERLPYYSEHNIINSIDLIERTKINLIRCLGILIHQKKMKDAIIFFKNVQKEWSFNVQFVDWKLLNSYLTWGYPVTLLEIENSIKEVLPSLRVFFIGIGCDKTWAYKLSMYVLLPNLKKRNHLVFGKIIGAFFNKIGVYWLNFELNDIDDQK